MLRAEVADFERHAVAVLRRGEPAAAGVVQRGHELADHFHAVGEVEHHDAVGRLQRSDLALGRVQQLGALHHFVDVGRLDRNGCRLKERIHLAQLVRSC